ncbi:hypothetical protein F8144_03950 [Streptomyces triticiradicis]|uniref:Uncharacterized protein n=1 Tax=Streptomyces triticiradicis TaxID=2651189 RepID=A0A7J5DN77_9ACTN|nr:hypothetical protein F8144_03950 [Streptomyces triticiradicis]
MCGVRSDGRRHGTILVRVRADALRRLGLHPDQPTSGPADPLPPKWWGPWARRAALPPGPNRA